VSSTPLAYTFKNGLSFQGFQQKKLYWACRQYGRPKLSKPYNIENTETIPIIRLLGFRKGGSKIIQCGITGN